MLKRTAQLLFAKITIITANHALRTPNSELLGFDRQIGQVNSGGIWGIVFLTKLSAPVLVQCTAVSRLGNLADLKLKNELFKHFSGPRQKWSPFSNVQLCDDPKHL